MSTEVETTPRKARRQLAAAALNAISAIVLGPRGAKKAARTAAKIQRKDERKAKLLAMLTAPDEPLKFRVALIKATVAIKNGAVVEELQACTALQAVTTWPRLAEPVAQFATAKGVDPATLLAGLGCTAPVPTQGTETLQSDVDCKAPTKAPSPSMEAPPATEAPKAATEPKPAPKAPHGRHVVKGRG